MIPDLSHHNQLIEGQAKDFQKAAFASGLVILKATEGTTFVDPTYKERARILNALDVSLGSYHFARPSPSRNPDPEERAVREAQHFNSVRKPGKSFLDWEYHLADIPQAYADRWIAKFLTIVPDCIVYCSWSTAQRLAGNFPLWVARWTGHIPDYGVVLDDQGLLDREATTARRTKMGDLPPKIREHPVVLHQYTSTGAYPGVRGNVDLSDRPIFGPTEPEATGTQEARKPSGVEPRQQ